jgi:hypothetical protein
VIKEMTGNPAFPNPPVDLKAVQAAVDELNTATAAQVQGGTAATAFKNTKREAVNTLLRKLAHYVHDNCGNDPAVLLSSGFQLATGSRTGYPLAKPSSIGIDGREKRRARPHGVPDRQRPLLLGPVCSARG